MNGEGIYGTRPWYLYGEGNTEMPHKTIESPMTYKDIRYTTKDGYLYAFVLDWPVKRGEIQDVVFPFIVTMSEQIDSINSVELLGHDGPVEWEAHGDGLTVKFPEEKPCEFAFCLKIDIN